MSRPEDRDLTPIVDLRQGRPAAGPVRERKPVYVDLLPLPIQPRPKGWPNSPSSRSTSGGTPTRRGPAGARPTIPPTRGRTGTPAGTEEE